MESTKTELAIQTWNGRVNQVKNLLSLGEEVVDLGSEYYQRFLLLSTVLIKLFTETQDKLPEAWDCMSASTDYEVKVYGAYGYTIPVTFSKENGGNASITIGDHFNPFVRIGMLYKESSLNVLNGWSTVQQNMIVLGNTSNFYSPCGTENMEDSIKESIEYLGNEQYKAYMIYGKNNEGTLDLTLYQTIIETIINDFKLKGFIE